MRASKKAYFSITFIRGFGHRDSSIIRVTSDYFAREENGFSKEEQAAIENLSMKSGRTLLEISSEGRMLHVQLRGHLRPHELTVICADGLEHPVGRLHAGRVVAFRPYENSDDYQYGHISTSKSMTSEGLYVQYHNDQQLQFEEAFVYFSDLYLF